MAVLPDLRSGETPSEAESHATFRPSPWLPGAALQTIVPALLPGPPLGVPTAEVWVEVDPGTRVRLDVNRPPGKPAGTLLLIHGMGGSSLSNYMLYCTLAALDRGWVAVRMNLRTCGGTEHAARTVYNAGQGEDAGTVLAHLEADGSFPRPYYAAGFSLGGNLLLRYAGTAGAECRADAVAGVNPPIDLEQCLAALELPRNAFYHMHYVHRLCAQLRRVREVRGWPEAPPRFRGVRTLRRFDDRYTAPDSGYSSAAEYYARASSAPHLRGIRRPTVVLSAQNDPFVPVQMFRAHHGLTDVRFLHPRAGGHCGYRRIGRPPNWAAIALTAWFDAKMRQRLT